MREWLARFAGLFGVSATEKRIDEEAEFHLEMLTEDHVRRGLDPREARLAALRDFGGRAGVQEQFREQSLLPSLESLRGDVVFAARSFTKTPGVTVLILATLGLGIGANTAIFSFLNELLLRPLPFADPSTLVHIGRNWHGESGATAPRDYVMVRDKAQSFSRVGTMFLHHGENVETPGASRYVTGIKVSEGYLPVLGVQPLLGRTFTVQEDRPNGPKCVVISHSLWQSGFGGNADILGRSVKIGGVPHEIVGVMPASIETRLRAQMWLPLQSTGTGDDTNYTTIARLAPGVSMGQAAGEVESLFKELDRNQPPSKEAAAISRVIPLHELSASEFRKPVLLLYAGVCVVLFVACINVANLLLARSAARSKEIAVRAALGAGRARIARQMLTESLLLAAAGGLAGLAIGQALVVGLQKLIPYAEFQNVTLDRTTLWFTVAVSMLVGLVFGLAPALQSLRVDLMDTMKENGGKSSAGKPALRGRQALVFCQVALCTLLLAGSGLLVRTVLNLRSVEMGFNPANLITAPMTINADKQQDKNLMLAYYYQALQRVLSIAGVEDAAITTQLPVEGQFNLGVRLPDSAEPDRPRGMQFRIQTRSTFRTLGMRIVRGRDFAESDQFGAPAVAVVNEAFARRYFPDQDVLGKRILRSDIVYTIAGVVNDVRETGLRNPTPPVIYTLFNQTPQNTIRVVHQFVPAKWIVRVRPGANPGIAAQIRREVGTLDPVQPFQEFQTMQSRIAKTMQLEQFLMALLAAFAMLTLLMVASGLYGTLAYAVSQRRQEIGIRMAMGARWYDVVALVSAHGVMLVGGGLVVGLAGSYWGTRLLSGFLFDVPALDPKSLLAASALLLFVSLLACAGPSLHAVRTDPMRALRVE